jgi:hypothetical protein
MMNAVDAFKEVEEKRAVEMCDGMRRYAIFVSAMLANLQYDVQVRDAALCVTHFQC